jgi:hypothetical protein
MRKHVRPLPALVAAVLLAAACANGPSENAGSSGDSSAGGKAGSNAGSGADQDGAARQPAVKFANCMRENGVSQFPDPDASGRLTIDGIANDSSVDVTSTAWQRAIAACKDLEPAGFTGDKRTAAEQAVALEFARCIRENGVKDFPDPDPNGPLVDTNRIPSLNGKGGRELPALNAAMKKCGEVYADQLGLRE